MNSDVYIEKAVGELQFTKREENLIPEEISAAQKRALECFLRGNQAEAYRQMVLILRYYLDKNEDLPGPCEKLFKSLVICDVVMDCLPA